jgi:hypothetical protein
MMHGPTRSRHNERVSLTTGKMQSGTGDLYRHKRNMRSDASKLSRVRTKSFPICKKKLSLPSPSREEQFEKAYKKVLSLRSSHLKRRLTIIERRKLRQAVAKQCGFHEEHFLFVYSPPPPSPSPPTQATPAPCGCQVAIEMLHSEISRLRQMVFDLEDRFTRSSQLSGCRLPTGDAVVTYEDPPPLKQHTDPTYADTFGPPPRAVRLRVPTSTVDFKDLDYIYTRPTELVKESFYRLTPPSSTQVAVTVETPLSVNKSWETVELSHARALLAEISVFRPSHEFLQFHLEDTTFRLSRGRSLTFYPKRYQVWYHVPAHSWTEKLTTYKTVTHQEEFNSKEHQEEISDLAHRMIRKSYLTIFPTSSTACSECVFKRRSHIFEHHPLISNSLSDEDLSLTRHWRYLMQQLGATCDQ